MKEEGNYGANKIFVFKRKLVSRFLHETAHLRLRWWMGHLAAVLYHISIEREKVFLFYYCYIYASIVTFILLDESEERSAERLIMCSKLQNFTAGLQSFAVSCLCSTSVR